MLTPVNLLSLIKQDDFIIEMSYYCVCVWVETPSNIKTLKKNAIT